METSMFSIHDIVMVKEPFNHTFSESYEITEIINQENSEETVYILGDAGAFAEKYLKEQI